MISIFQVISLLNLEGLAFLLEVISQISAIFSTLIERHMKKYLDDRILDDLEKILYKAYKTKPIHIVLKVSNIKAI